MPLPSTRDHEFPERSQVTANTAHTQLNRAHVQGKVIQANLEHLGVVLSDQNGALSDELASLTEGFGHYVRRLSDACMAADRSDSGRSDVPKVASSSG